MCLSTHYAWAQSELFETSNGERIFVEDREFSIVPPVGWNVYRDYQGAMLYMEPPKEEGQLYQRSIRIMAFNEPVYVDELTFQSFAEKIVENFSKASNSIVDYRIRNQTAIEYSGDRKAGLYYTEFLLAEVPLMQMHILVSSENFHFVMTYTDLMEKFEADSSPELDEAYASLVSAELSGDPPTRNDSLFHLLIGVGSLITLVVMIKLMMMWRVKRIASRLEDLDEAYDTQESSAVTSEFGEAVSEFSSDDEKTRILPPPPDQGAAALASSVTPPPPPVQGSGEKVETEEEWKF